MRRKLRRAAGPGSLASSLLEGESWRWSAGDRDESLSTARLTAGGCGAGRRTSRGWPGRRARSRSSMRTPRGRRLWSDGGNGAPLRGDAPLFQVPPFLGHTVVEELCTLARSAVGGTSSAIMPNRSMPSPSTPSSLKALITLCCAAAEPPSRNTTSRMVQFSERRTTSPAHCTLPRRGAVATMSPQAIPRTNQGMLSSRAVPSPWPTAHKLSIDAEVSRSRSRAASAP